MVALRLENFGGMVPLLSRRLLPENMASDTTNTYLRGGEVRGIREPALIWVFPPAPITYSKAFRIPDPAVPATPVWLPFKSKYGALHPNPLVNDAFNRYLWLDENAPGVPAPLRLNSLQRIKDGIPSLLLGVPAPDASLTVTVSGGSPPLATRSYVYTYVNIFGEEGPPSLPVVVTGNANGVWEISDIVAPVNPLDGGDDLYGRDTVRIYRTQSGQSGATTFFRVAEQAANLSTYSDTRTDAEIALDGLILESTPWEPPPEMEGIVAMPNGFFAGWAGKNLYFSEPYRPWAWPPAYTLATNFPILGCGIVDQTLVALTETAPVLVSGIRPASMSMAKTAYAEPCVDPNSIAQAPEGVYFASQNGLMLISPAGLAPITREVIGRDEWNREYVPAIGSTVAFDSQYISHNSAGAGFVFDPRGIQSGIIKLANFPTVRAIWLDPWTSEAHMMIDNAVYRWSDPQATFIVATWASKEYQFPRPINLGAVTLTLDARFAGGSSDIVAEEEAPSGSPWLESVLVYNYGLYNAAAYNTTPLDGQTPPGNPAAQPWPFWYGVQGTGDGEPPLPDGAVCELTVFASGAVVFRQIVQSGRVYRLPSGFKTDTWQLQVRTRVPVLNIQIAETAKELARV